LGVRGRKVVFGIVSPYVYNGWVAIVIDAMVGDCFPEGRDDGWLGGRAFDVFVVSQLDRARAGLGQPAPCFHRASVFVVARS